MKDFRINLSGTYLNFTCENRRFKTDITKGYEHHAGDTYKGSVTVEPLYEDGGSLWMEHVIEISSGKPLYWFMWYNEDGIPVIPLSGVIDEADINEVLRNIAQVKLNIP